MSELMLDVGQANDLKLAMRKNGFTNGDLYKLCQGDRLAQILPFLNGYAEIVMRKHIVDCDAAPFCLDGWKVVEHRQGGRQFEWDPAKVDLYLSIEQKRGMILGKEFRKKLAKQPVLNANVLDFLLKNPELIPSDWKGKVVFFWGTIYRDESETLCVRGLDWFGNKWCSFLNSLDLHLGDNYLAAVSVASS